MELPEELPSYVRITARAQKDLEKILKKDRKNFSLIWGDLKKLANHILPQRPKKLKGFESPIWQVDSGDFRIFYTLANDSLWIRGVIRKPEQKHRFKSIS